MLVDHVGAVFFPDTIAFRIIGRLSFPLFVWLLVQGEAHTRDAGRYGLRLAALGVVTQPIYQATFSTTELNILFQLLVGLVCLRFARRFPRLQIPVWLVAAVLTELGSVGYGGYGIGLIVLTRYFRPNLPWALAWVGLHLVEAWMYGPFQLPALVVPLLFFLANGERGPKARWFYAFYPGHLALLWLMRQGLS